MLKEFGGFSVEYINSTIQELNKNLTYAETVFNDGAKQKTEEKQQQILRVR
jgi:hypothetical protein